MKEIIRQCKRCGNKFCGLGRVLQYGKFYPAVTIKGFDYKTNKEFTEDRPSHWEIKKAVCKSCAMILFDYEPSS